MSTLRSLIESKLLPQVSSEFPRPDSLISSLLNQQLPVEGLLNSETRVQAACQQLNPAKSKALTDLFYCELLRLSFKPGLITPVLVSAVGRSVHYLSSQSLIDSAKFRQKLSHKFIEAVSSLRTAKELVDYAKASKDTANEGMKQIIEMKFKAIPWGSNFLEDARMLNYCYELQDYSMDVAALKSMLESHFKDHLILSGEENPLKLLSSIGLHPQFFNYITMVTSELCLSNALPTTAETDPGHGNLRKQDIAFKGIIYAYTFSNYKVEVRKALYKNTEVAVKIYKTNDQAVVDSFLKEVQTIERLSCNKGFIKMYGTYHSRPDSLEEGQFEVGVCMEFCPKSLEQDIAERTPLDKKYSEEYMLNSVRDLLEGLIFMKKHEGMLHRDIKPDNILISTSGELKLIDFNTVQDVEHSVTIAPSVVFNPVGTLNYMAPEQRTAREQGRAVHGRPEQGDVFSLGLTILRMETLYPMQDLNTPNNRNQLQRAIRVVREKWLSDLLTSMLQWDPAKRLPFKRLIGMLPNQPTLPQS